ncbi:MAG: hypothetical protein ACLFQK_01355 [Fibrobacterota bacterium]
MQNKEFDTFEVLNTSWNILKDNFFYFFGYLVILSLLTVIPIAGFVLAAIMSGGYIIVSFKHIKSLKTDFHDFFAIIEHFAPMALFVIAAGAIIIVGFFILVIPGIYFCISYILAAPLIIDRKMGFWKAMEESRNITGRNFARYAFFTIILLILNFAGLIPMGLGLLITIPLSAVAISVLYSEAVGIVTDDSELRS